MVAFRENDSPLEKGVTGILMLTDLKNLLPEQTGDKRK